VVAQVKLDFSGLLERVWLRPAHGRGKQAVVKTMIASAWGRVLSPEEAFPTTGRRPTGNLGPAERFGTSFPFFRADQLLPLTISLETSRTDTGCCFAAPGHLVFGAKTRLSDTSSVYVEERLPEWRVPLPDHSHHRNQPHGEETGISGSAEVGKLATPRLVPRPIARRRDHTGYGVAKMQFSPRSNFRRITRNNST